MSINLDEYRRGVKAGYKKALKDILSREECVKLFERRNDAYVESERETFIIESKWIRQMLQDLSRDTSGDN